MTTITIDHVNLTAPLRKMEIPQGFEPSIAMELGNLVRIAYKDYDNSKHQELQSQVLKEGNTILTHKKEMITKTIDQYSINSSEGSNTDFLRYKVRKVLIVKEKDILKDGKDEFHRFGFILERESEQNNETMYFFVFRGTISLQEWILDAHFKLVSPCFNVGGQGVQVSEGFNKIYDSHGDSSSLNNTVQNVLNELATKGEKKDKIYVTGHSLGAAIATLSTLHIAENGFAPTLYAFASPRVGDKDFAKRFQEKVNYEQTFRIANCEDLVNSLPTGTLTHWIGPDIKKEEKEKKNLIEMGKQEFIDKSINAAIHFPWISGLFSADPYAHVGKPVYFSYQTGYVSSNHNMDVTYCGALPTETSNH